MSEGNFQRVQIDVTEPLHAQVAQAIAALGAYGRSQGRFPSVMDRGGDLVRVSAEQGKLEPLPRATVPVELSRAIDFGKVDKEGEWRSVHPPRDVVDGVATFGYYPGVPRAGQLISAPALVPDGEDLPPRLLREPGLDAATETYYRPSPELEGARVDDAPVPEMVDWARRYLLEELLGDFDFSSEADRAHALELILLPFVRPFIAGQTPIHVVLAPDVGSGKTYLAQAALIPSCGLVPAQASAGQEDEWRKRITATLRSAPPAVLLDNLSGDLDSPALAAAVTGGVWSDRILGESREVTFPVRNVWVATGNNLALSTEQVRRAIPIFLEPTGDVRPSDRPTEAYRHPDLLGWALRERRKLVEAALTIVNHWAAGRVSVTSEGLWEREWNRLERGRATLGSFEEWARVMGGVLHSLGGGLGEHFLANRDKLKTEADEGHVDAAEFLEAWQAARPDPIYASELAELCQLGRELHDLVPRNLPRGRDLREQLGRWLGMHKKAKYDGLRIERIPGARTRWVVRGERKAPAEGE